MLGIMVVALPDSTCHSIDPVIHCIEIRALFADALNQHRNIISLHCIPYINDIRAVEIETNASHHA